MKQHTQVNVEESGLRLTATFRKGEKFVIGQLVEIPGVVTQGSTLEECRENLRDALREYLLARRELHRARRQGILAEEAFPASLPS